MFLGCMDEPAAEEVPNYDKMHRQFVSTILQVCANMESNMPQDQQQPQQANCQGALHEAYMAAVLQYGSDAEHLKRIIPTYAAAVLRVSQALGDEPGKHLVQLAYDVSEQVHSQLQHHQQEKQLLAIARRALGLQDPAQSRQPEQQVQQPCRRSWQLALQQLPVDSSTQSPLFNLVDGGGKGHNGPPLR